MTSKFSADALQPTNASTGGASRTRKDNLDYLALDANKSWSSTLRGSPREPTYASFMVHASQNTIIDIGGARLGVTAGPISGSLQLMFDDSASPNGTLQWKSLNVHIATGTYGGKPLAALPVLTVAIDPATSTWTLFSGSRLLADHLPLIPSKKDSRTFTLTAGNAGAWLCGLVLADENPLYLDDNFNGIDDAFEKTKRNGQLLPASASIPERQLLAKEWKESQRQKPPPAPFVARPLPDGK
ncbi:MAG: hypothetical protein HZA93_02260 [Verrucomicrobia bacterium]|nr:hypothetical protein [Verrucomicrobiota bacterium]